MCMMFESAHSGRDDSKASSFLSFLFRCFSFSFCVSSCFLVDGWVIDHAANYSSIILLLLLILLILPLLSSFSREVFYNVERQVSNNGFVK